MIFASNRIKIKTNVVHDTIAQIKQCDEQHTNKTSVNDHEFAQLQQNIHLKKKI